MPKPNSAFCCGFYKRPVKLCLTEQQSERSESLPRPLPSMASTVFTLPLFLFFTLLSLHLTFSAKIIVPEEGYTVTSVLDGHKLHINPHSVLPRPSSTDLIVLDSANSVFYTVQFPMSQESVVQRFSGNGFAGYLDGDVDSARFDQPRSFAVDLKGNVYVADRNNQAIRKISSTGVTTIAGGFSERSSSKEGPALNATFSNDFELAFIPAQCALLVSDHQFQLVRQINLKEEDCALGSKSGIGAVMIWTLGLGISCLLGLVIGIAVRPYIIPHTGRLQPSPFLRDMEALPNQSGEASTDTQLLAVLPPQFLQSR